MTGIANALVVPVKYLK